jgi:hypothetical protein
MRGGARLKQTSWPVIMGSISQSSAGMILIIPFGPKTPWEVTGSAIFLSLCKGATIGSRFERRRDVSSSEELS